MNSNFTFDNSEETEFKDEAEEILKAWRKYSLGIIPTPRNINSKVFIEKNKGKYISKKFIEIVSDVLQEYSSEDIIKSIKNYFEILFDQNFYYDYVYKSIGQFLHTGLKYKTGFYIFLDSQNPHEKFKNSFEPSIYSYTKKVFLPITEENSIRGLDKSSQKYYSFNIDQLENVSGRFYDVEKYIDVGLVGEDFSNFWELELCIAALLWQRKQNPQPELLKKFISAWESEKDNILN